MKPLPAVLILFLGLALGVGVGLMLAAQPTEDQALAEAQQELAALRLELDSLKRQAAYSSVAKEGMKAPRLSREQLRSFEEQMDVYIRSLRKRRYLSVSDAFGWFRTRWVEVLKAYSGVEARQARADVLTQLLVSVRSSIDPSDFITWQVEWLGHNWLLEVQQDIDGDGLPARRRDTAQSIELVPTTACRAAMELNLLVRDAIVLVDHSLPCSESAPRVSGLLTGKTYDALLTSFVRLMKESGYVVVDKALGKRRSIMVGVPR